MSGVDVDQWLEQWIEEHLTTSSHVERKADMHDEAKACATAAQSAGISIAKLKAAADGDLEAYLVGRQNIQASRRGSTTTQGSGI